MLRIRQGNTSGFYLNNSHLFHLEPGPHEGEDIVRVTALPERLYRTTFTLLYI